MTTTLRRLWLDEEAQDIAEYVLLLAVVIVFTVAAVAGLANQASTSIGSAGQAITPQP